MIRISPQLLPVNGAETRSSIAAVPELPERRLTASDCPTAVQTPGVNTPASRRSTPASPTSFSPSVSSCDAPLLALVGESESVMPAPGMLLAPKLTCASATPAGSVVAVLQHGGESWLISQVWPIVEPESIQCLSDSVGEVV